MPTGIIQAQESHSNERLTDLPTPIADGDAATKKYVDDNAGGGGGGAVAFSIPGGRLTTESGVPVSTSDRTAQSTLYYTPFKHNNVYTWSGSAWQAKTFSEISLSLTLTSGKNYDVFINSAATALSLSAAWTNDTTRADALGKQDGVTVLSSDHTKLWLGTIRASGTNVTADSAGGGTTQVGGQRFIWNAYNQVRRALKVIDTTDSWTYTTATIRQANAASGNKVEYVTGDIAILISATVYSSVNISSGPTTLAKVGIGIDSTTTFSGFITSGVSGAGIDLHSISGRYDGYPGLGYHYVSWNEAGQTVGGTCSFQGDGGTLAIQSGLVATMDA
jgi:hypothetical protein